MKFKHLPRTSLKPSAPFSAVVAEIFLSKTTKKLKRACLAVKERLRIRKDAGLKLVPEDTIATS
jgi:hypothetical protein